MHYLINIFILKIVLLSRLWKPVAPSKHRSHWRDVVLNDITSSGDMDKAVMLFRTAHQMYIVYLGPQQHPF